jgi:hypothetical protein
MPTSAPPLPRLERRRRAARPALYVPAADPATDGVLAFLEDVLAGDRAWRLSEVRALADLHLLAAGGHWDCDILGSEMADDVNA